MQPGCWRGDRTRRTREYRLITALILLAGFVRNVWRQWQPAISLNQRNRIAGKMQRKEFTYTLAHSHIKGIG